MKKIFLSLFLLLAVAMIADAQIYVSCTARRIFQYNKETDSFDFLYKYEENSLFELYKDLMMFKHTTPTITSSYYIQESSFDEDNGMLMCMVKSDVGNDYFYNFEFENEEVMVIYTNDDDELVMIIFTVKKMWTD